MTNVRECCARLGAALVGAAMLLTGLAAVAAERGAVLTRILATSLGGNAQTTVVCCVSGGNLLKEM